MCFGGLPMPEGGHQVSVVCSCARLVAGNWLHAHVVKSTHRNLKEDMSSKMSVGRVAMSPSKIVLSANWIWREVICATIRMGTRRDWLCTIPDINNAYVCV